MQENKPIAKFRAAGIDVAVWESSVQLESGTRAMHRVSIERRYRDRDGVWKSSHSMARNDIPVARHLLQQAFAYLLERPWEGNGDDAASPHHRN